MVQLSGELWVCGLEEHVDQPYLRLKLFFLANYLVQVGDMLVVLERGLKLVRECHPPLEPFLLAAEVIAYFALAIGHRFI